MCQYGTQIFQKMLVISSREFREKQKMYLDLADKNEQVIVQRGKNKAYLITPIKDTDRHFSDPAVMTRIAHSIAQAERREVITVKKEEINKLLGL